MADTIWGFSQSQKEYAPGIVFYSTSSHGGIVLNAERGVEFYKKFPNFITFSGYKLSFEEDCDINAIFIAFSQFFNKKTVENAIKSCYRLAQTYDEWQEIVDYIEINPELPYNPHD